MPSTSRATKGLLRQRVEFCLRLRLQGATSWDIWPVVAADGQPYPAGHGRAWAVSERTVRRYLARGDKLLEQMAGERREASFNRFLVQRRQLYNRALAMGDVRAALAASDSEAKLLGLFDPKAAPPPTTGDVTTFSDDQLESVIRGHDFTRPGESPRPPTAKPQAFDTGPGI